MRIFLSWSGEGSRQIAQELHVWLRKVIQSIKPWMSEEDIEKGANWSVQLTNELEKSNAFIVCLTPENINSQWLHFEAGRASKSLGNELVCPYLLGLRKADVVGPFSQFQCTNADKEDTLRLLYNLNTRMGDHAIEKEILDSSFSSYWQELEKKIQGIEFGNETPLARRNNDEILAEVLEKVREIRNKLPTKQDKDKTTRRLAIWLQKVKEQNGDMSARDMVSNWNEADRIIKDLF